MIKEEFRKEHFSVAVMEGCYAMNFLYAVQASHCFLHVYSVDFCDVHKLQTHCCASDVCGLVSMVTAADGSSSGSHWLRVTYRVGCEIAAAAACGS